MTTIILFLGLFTGVCIIAGLAGQIHYRKHCAINKYKRMFAEWEKQKKQ